MASEGERMDVEDGGDAGPEEIHSDNEYECDFSAYELFHEGSIGAPCLSFDIVPDGLGDDRTCKTPVTCYFVAGTQTDSAHINSIILMKMQNLHKIKQTGNDSSSEEEDSELEDEEDEGSAGKPIISSSAYKHEGCINRIRTTAIDLSLLCATWSELGQVHIWDMKNMLDKVNSTTQEGVTPRLNQDDETPLYTFQGHSKEGFAMDWSKVIPGTLATGDCAKSIFVWNLQEGGKWAIGEKPFAGHTASVEDIQWSPNEPHVFSSCSVDKTIRIWDDRDTPEKACKITVNGAHDSDVNVINWNRNDPFLVSGGDDGFVKIWDLRLIQDGSPVASLKHHKGPITTVEWHPFDQSVLASGGEDNQVLQWDLAVERDSDAKVDEDMNIPAQLLFEHQGQKNVKELHWHMQIPGLLISTAESGFHLFKTISC